MSLTVRRGTFVGAAVLLLLASSASPQEYEDARGSITLAFAGDAIITRHLKPYREPEFLALRDLIVGATAAFVNLEILFHDYQADVIPSAESGGTYMRADPELANELTWMGFDLVSMSNNHTMDYGAGGARHTKEAAEAAGLTVAGFGENLAEARAPAYLDTPGGRVALISMSSTFSDAMRAGDQRPDMRGRPGLDPIRHQTVVTLTPEEMEGLRTAVARFRPGFGRGGRAVVLGDIRFVEGDTPGVTTVPHEGDLAALVEAVKDAKRQADWVVVTSHTHEGAESRDVPADFIVEVAHRLIDAGADMFVGHGPHVLRGVEVYHGAPILYSMANFIFENETVELQPADNYQQQGLEHSDLPGHFYDTRNERSGGGFPADPAYWDSVVAETEFENGTLKEVRLHPITLGFGESRAVRGRPMLADAEAGQRILEGLAGLSAAFGTEISIENGVGVIRP